MKFFVILIALHFLAAAYIECNSTVTSDETNGSSGRNISKRSVHNRLHIQGDENWEENDKYKFNVKIVWKAISQSMQIKSQDEIGKLKDGHIHYKCSGAIIDPNWVITAASCFQPYVRQLEKKFNVPMEFTVQGTVKAEEQYRNIKRVHVHDEYIEYTMRQNVDIALVEVENQFYTDTTQYIYAAQARIGKNLAYSGYKSGNNMRHCLVMNFGEDALYAEAPFTENLSASDVRAAGPKYCEIIQRRLTAPWWDKTNGEMHDYSDSHDDMFDSYFICTTPHEWYKGEQRLPENEDGLGCFGEVGGTLTCDESDVLVGIQSKTFGPNYCDGKDSYTVFMGVGEDRVYKFIQKHIPDIGAVVPLKSTDFPYEL